MIAIMYEIEEPTTIYIPMAEGYIATLSLVTGEETNCNYIFLVDFLSFTTVDAARKIPGYGFTVLNIQHTFELQMQ
jgi:hypothetical protein